MNSKKMKLFKRIIALVCIVAMEVSGVLSSVCTVFAANSRKIDVWDFGGVEETDTTLYTNNITAADWDNCTNVSSAALFLAGTTTFGDLTITHEANDRLYSTSSKNYGSMAIATTSYEDGYTANGMYYCNGTGGEKKRFLTIDNVVAGDKIIIYMASSKAVTETMHLQYLGSEGTQLESATFGNTGVKIEFVAQYNGTYKIYTETAAGGKPVYNRVVRVPGVEVTGTIDFADYTGSGHVVKFVNNTNGQETVATVDGTSYSAVLAAGYTYTAVLSGAQGYGFTNTSKSVSTSVSEILTGKSGADLVVEAKSIYSFTGKITGFDAAYDVSKLGITMVPPADSSFDSAVMNIQSDLTFSVSLEPDVEYTMELSGVNDYEIVSTGVITNNMDMTEDIQVALKAKYSVTGGFTGNGSAAVTALTFKNVDDNYTYAGTVTENGYSVELRDGSYEVEAVIENYTTTTHVVVNGAAVSKDLMFVYTGAAESLTWVSDIYVGYADKANNYATVNEAVKAAKAMNPSSEEQRITIHIAPGTYREQITVNVPYVTFMNDDASQEVKLTWYYGIGYAYYSIDSTGFYNAANAYDKYEKRSPEKWGSATYVTSAATAFRAENITFEASFNRYITDEELADGVECSGLSFVRKYGADVTSKAATERAAALYVGADKTEFYNCTFLGSQDTLYTGDSSVHSYYKNCFIEGNTDFIFGDGNVVFDNCELSFYGYSTGSVGGYLTAAKDLSTLGYLFRNCTVTANDSLTVTPGYFGRPWGAGARVTFVNTKLEYASLIVPEGWTEMSGNKPANANYVEYNTTSLDGNTVDTSSRVAGTVATAAPTTAVTDYFGSWTPEYYVAESATVEFTTIPYVIDNGDINAPYPGHTLTAGYSLGTANDANDASIISWYRVSGTTETLVKTSTANVDKTYQIASEDIGCNIKVVVTPVTSSGNTGTAASYTVEAVVRDGYENPDASGSDVILGDGVNIFLAGDSTVKDYSANGMYMNGIAQNEGAWGEYFQTFFNSDKVTVLNYANGGRSTRNFINEGSLDKIAEKIGEGDYLFIQFGHNDCSNASGYLEDRYVPLGEPDANGVYPVTAGTEVSTPSSLTSKYGDTFYSYDCGGTFKWYLLQYINVAKENGATPVLVTPVARMYYTSDGTIKAHHDSTDTTTGTLVTSNNAYVTAIKQLAEEQDVLLVDGFELTKAMYEAAYAADPSASGTTSVYGTQVMSSGDSTHSNKLGGFITAAYIASELQNMNLNISYAVKMPSQVLGETTDGKTVFSVSGSSALTAYASNTDFASTADYWMGIGQNLINAIGVKAEELASSSTNPDPGTGTDPEPSGESGLVQLEDGKFHLFIEGTQNTEYSGLFEYDSAWFMLTDGVVDTSLVGMVEYDNALFYVADGQVVNHSGLVQNGDDWYFIGDGQVKNVSQLVMYDNEWFVVKEGKLDMSYNDIYEYDGARFFVAAGRLIQNMSGLQLNGTDWYYLSDGQVADYTGLVQYNEAWFYVINGKLASDYTGTVAYDGATFNVANGQVYF